MTRPTVLTKVELLRIIKRFIADENRGISLKLFAEVAGISLRTLTDTFQKELYPVTEYVQIRVSKAYISWKKGEIAVMQNWDNTRFTEYRKVAKPRLARGYGLQVVGGEIKMKLGIVNKADYDHNLADQLDRG